MGDQIEVAWDGEQLGQALLERVRPIMGQGLAKGLNQAALLWDAAMQKHIRKRTFGPQIQGTIGNRSGNLKKSLKFRVISSQKLEENRLVLFVAGARYARAQQYGATITPRNARRLAIPGPENLTGAGLTKTRSARAWFDEFKKTGQIALIRSRRTPGNTVVLWRRTKRSAWEHWWTLASKVTLPGPTTDGSPSRLQFFETYERQAKDRAAILQHTVTQALRASKIEGVLEGRSVRIL